MSLNAPTRSLGPTLLASMLNVMQGQKRYVLLVFPLYVQLTTHHMKTKNIFDSLPAICTPKAADLHDKLDRYLSTDPEHTADVLLWWAERKHLYPCLSRMALDYLSIPGAYFILWNCHSSADIHLQLPPLTLNMCLARAEFCYHMYETNFQFNRHGH